MKASAFEKNNLWLHSSGWHSTFLTAETLSIGEANIASTDLFISPIV
jgi:hypothetical protein